QFLHVSCEFALRARGKAYSSYAAGITDHRWTMWELLWNKVPDVAPVPFVRTPAALSQLLTLPSTAQRVLAA
ncbi:MAG: hypothetical protein ABJA50_13440, partial [Chloroflexota bacterium]